MALHHTRNCLSKTHFKPLLSLWFARVNTTLLENLKQENLNQILLKPLEKQTRFLFDEIIYLTAPQQTFDKISTRRFSNKEDILSDLFVQKNELVDAYKMLSQKEIPEYNIEKDILSVAENFPDKVIVFKESLWRNIHHYPIDQQIEWFLRHSNFTKIRNKTKFTVKELKIDDLRNEKEITEKLLEYIKSDLSKKTPSQNIINISLGSNETQVSWHVLAEAGLLPEKSRLIKTYDDKSDRTNTRFKNFSIREVPLQLISSIGTDLKFYKSAQSKKRKLVNLKMQSFLDSGFSILLIGERGIGKSYLAEANHNATKAPFIQANCASFDNDNKAESELFGYMKGAFTGANEKKDGLLIKANKGVLFLDEIHYLSKFVQAKLMKAMQTNENNKMKIRRISATEEEEVECKIIFATNKTIEELKELLLPDFYDRIAQHVLKIPSLKETPEDRISDWEEVCRRLKFKSEPKIPKDLPLLEWIKTLDLYGNYRDLQKIAMYYNIYHQFDDETKRLIKEEDNINSAYTYAKKEFEKYHSFNVLPKTEKYNFNASQTTKQMIADYHYELQNWAVRRFGGRKQAIEHFKKKGDTISEKTFNNWKEKRAFNT